MMKSNNILALGDYYTSLRELCHGVKDGNARAIREAAQLLLGIVPDCSTLIPLPSHYGVPTYMLDLANLVASKKNCRVDPCIKSCERKKLYDLKMRGQSAYLDFRLTHKPTGNLFLIDNCVDTGTTYEAAKRLLGEIPIITIAINKNNYNYGQTL